MPTNIEQLTPEFSLSPEAIMLKECINDVPEGSEVTTLEAVASIIDVSELLGNVEHRYVVLNSLKAKVLDRENIAAQVAQAIERLQDDKYGEKLLDISLEEVPVALERILKGKNPAFVVRASQWGELEANDPKQVIERSFAGVGNFVGVKEEKFPNAKMIGVSSRLHLDNFHTDADPGFRYAFSVSRLEKGRVLFIAGLAGKRAMNDSPRVSGKIHPYDEMYHQLNGNDTIKTKYVQAAADIAAPRTDIELKNGQKLTAIVLNPGDVVFWPQGGPGSKKPSWHAFRQIGRTEERASVSYHYQQRDR